MKTNKENMSLIDRIDEIRANSVTDEEFKKVWGTSIDEHVDKMMAHVAEIDWNKYSLKKQ